MPIGTSFTYNTSNDANHLLGRPGQYTGKINFADTRIPASGNSGPDIDVSDGGSIEICANPQDAQNRFTYIHTISSSSAVFAEYEYVDGDVVLRLSKILTPDQAQIYLSILKQLQ